MRENTKWIMLITALAFVALMVFEWGMDLSGRSAAQFTGGEIGSVNGEPVTYEEYIEVYRQLYRQAQAQQAQPISSVQNEQLEDQAFQQVVNDRLIEQELRQRGIRVTEQEILQAARYAPPPEFVSAEVFQTDGQFDLDKYHRYLATNDPELLTRLEAYYRSVLPRNKLYQQVAAGAFVTDDELWRIYREQNERVSVRFLALQPASMIPDNAVTVTEEEVAAYYRSNRDDFERPASATVRYVAVDRLPTPADTAASRARAQEVRQRVVQGEPFDEVAREESADPGSGEQGGSLGTVQRGQMVAPFDEAVWSLPVGAISDPVLTRFGFHIIQVQSREADQAQVRHILIPVERTYESEEALFTVVDSLEILVEDLSLDAAAEELGLTVRETTLSPQIPFVVGLGNAQQGIDWVFETAIPGDISPIFEGQSQYYVMELVESTPARRLTLEEAAPTVRDVVRMEKKGERARQIGLDLVDRIHGGASMDSAAALHGLTVREAGPFTRMEFVPGMGSTNAAVGTAFGLPVGVVSDLVETPQGFFIIRVTDRQHADRDQFEAVLPQLRQQLIAGLQQERINRLVSALRENAEIVDNRDQVLQPATAQAAL